MAHVEEEFGVYISSSITQIMEKINGVDSLTYEQEAEVSKLLHTLDEVIDSAEYESCCDTMSAVEPDKDQTPVTPTAPSLNIFSSHNYETTPILDSTASAVSSDIYAEPIYSTPIKRIGEKRPRKFKALSFCKNDCGVAKLPTSPVLAEVPEPLRISQRSIEAFKSYVRDNMLSSTLNEAADDVIEEEACTNRIYEVVDLPTIKSRTPASATKRASRIRRIAEVQALMTSLSSQNESSSEQYYTPPEGVEDASDDVENHIYQTVEELASDYTTKLDGSVKKNRSTAVETKERYGFRKTRCGAVKVLAEKILLLSHYKDLPLVTGIPDKLYQNVSEFWRIGKVSISNLKLPISSHWRVKESRVNSGKFNDWFVMMISDGERVYSTEPSLLESVQDWVAFRGEQVEFDRLDSQFRIQLDVFHLRMRIEGTETTSAGFTFNKRVSKICRSFRKLQKSAAAKSEPPSTQFIRIASHALTIQDLVDVHRTCWPLASILQDTPLQPAINLELRLLPLQLSITRSGFLDVGTENGVDGDGIAITWNKRWCVLERDTLHLYRDPMQEQLGRPADESLLLRSTLRSRIHIAARARCARSNCLVVETAVRRTVCSEGARGAQRQRCVEATHFLRAENREEMNVWHQDLNVVLTLLGSWNELPYVETVVTDL